MNETAAMLETRLALTERLQRVALALALDEHARVATALLRNRSHDLGNAVQIVRLAALEIDRRNADEALAELVHDLRRGAEAATAVLTDMLAATTPVERSEAGPPVATAIRAAVELARPAIAAVLDLRVEVADAARTRATADELEAMAIAIVLDARDATRVSIELRERAIQGTPWIELLRSDDRRAVPDDPLAPLHLVQQLVERAGGEVSVAPGRAGLELVVALPVATAHGS